MIYFEGSFIEEGITTKFSEEFIKFGLGFFETIYYNGSKICHLDKHISRLESSLKEFRFAVPFVEYSSVLNTLINKNGLAGSVAKLNIYAFISDGETKVVAKAEPYTAKNIVYKLNINSNFENSFLNRHKSMNYMYQYLAYQRAIKGGYDNSCLVSEENQVFEAATGNLVFEKDGKFYTSKPDNRLEGVALQVFKEKYDVEEVDIYLRDFMGFRCCFILNSLMGMKPVSNINVFNFEVDEEFARKISDDILS